MGALVVAMRAHPAMERVQAYGCGLLALLCEREDRLRLATEVGAIEAVLAAMRAHEGAIEIQSSGCMAIGQYSSTPERAREVHYTLALVPIPIPMQPSLRSHSSVVASRFFLTLTHTHAFSSPSPIPTPSQAAELGAVVVLASAMRAHPKRPSLQANGCMALANVIIGSWLLPNFQSLTSSHSETKPEPEVGS